MGPYEIIGPISAGGMGEVYRARDSRLCRDVAIKVLSEAQSRNRDALERFEREARAASALNHPNIVTIYDIGRADVGSDSISYIAMELVEGQSLRQVISGGPIALEQLLDIASQATHALAVAHGKGIVHRDLKPENIMVSQPDGSGRSLVKILDFGLAKLELPLPSGDLSSAETSGPIVPGHGVIMGTVGYMSSEQAISAPISSHSARFSTRWRRASAPSSARAPWNRLQPFCVTNLNPSAT